MRIHKLQHFEYSKNTSNQNICANWDKMNLAHKNVLSLHITHNKQRLLWQVVCSLQQRRELFLFKTGTSYYTIGDITRVEGMKSETERKNLRTHTRKTTFLIYVLQKRLFYYSTYFFSLINNYQTY